MKRCISLSVIIFFSFIIIISSCKKDTPLNELILGKWKVQSITQIYYENNVKISEFTLYSFEEEMSIQFAEGGTGIIYQNNDIFGAFTWTLSGNTLTVDTGSTDVTQWIVNVEGNILTWSFEESEVVENVTQKYEYIYSASKIL